MAYQARPPAGDSGIPGRVPVNEDTYAVVFGWMVSRLGLKGASLFIFASIYGLTNSFGCFSAGVKYLMEWTGVSKAQVYRVLAALEEQGVLVSFKHWNGREWVTAYSAFRTREDAEAWKASHLLPGEPPADGCSPGPVPEKEELSAAKRPSASPSRRKPVARVPAARKGFPAALRPQACQPVRPVPVARSGANPVPSALPQCRARSEVPPGGGLVDRIYGLWKDAGLVGKGITKVMFVAEYEKALRDNIRRLRINQVDLEGAVRNYVSLLAVPQDERWWSVRMAFEPFTRQTIMRFLPGRFELDDYRKVRPGMRPAVSGCSSESRVRLDF